MVNNGSQGTNPDGPYLLGSRPSVDVQDDYNDDVYDPHENLYYKEISDWMDMYIGDSYARKSIVIQSCYSGAAIEPLSVDGDGNERERLIIMTAASEDETSWTTVGSDGETSAFSWEGRVLKIDGNTEDIVDIVSFKGILQNMGDFSSPHPLYTSYLYGYNAAENNSIIYLYDEGEETYEVMYSSTPQIYGSEIAEVTYL
ncbi:MAG: C13 family peptidase [Candidatus Saliniplasma sp.]